MSSPSLIFYRKLKEIRAVIPAHCFRRDTFRSLLYLLRDVLLAGSFWTSATTIDPFFSKLPTHTVFLLVAAESFRWLVWCLYWWFQGLVFTGIWVIGHECGHGAFSPHRILNNTIGFVIHSFLWTPYFSWKISHHRHHIGHASMERDEVYVPKTRSELGIPYPGSHVDYEEIFGDTPLFTLLMLLRQQLLAFPAYLLFNSSGQKRYPRWTNHFMPKSILFTKGQRRAVIISNVGLTAMIYAVRKAVSMYGVGQVIKYYGIPWLAVTHWFIMITYLHHTDPIIPHFRSGKWNFQRGAAATIDRDFLDNAKEATASLKAFIGDHYAFSNKPVFRALWDNYNMCQFVEDDGWLYIPRFEHLLTD
ncbi:delta 12 fatty acid epoxygenase [Mycena maculata]|uniref:Delta 12 fatty acid epoxygenase n=1 Tax=Mycena maculata TaxID=230809 RepID=A0AAD7KG54_9AGAR|nr:delta 12 fatty acid epoxygenase [Mycena maculata]